MPPTLTRAALALISAALALTRAALTLTSAALTLARAALALTLAFLLLSEHSDFSGRNSNVIPTLDGIPSYSKLPEVPSPSKQSNPWYTTRKVAG